MHINLLLEMAKMKKKVKKPSLNNFVAKHDHNKAAVFPDKKKDYKRKPKHKKPLREDIETIRKNMTPLSKEAKDARKPLSPEELIDARHDVIHKSNGKGRVANSVRNKRIKESRHD